MAVKGKWAQGIEPRNFRWVVKDAFAVCERPGGYGSNHRRVRRQEEIIWVREQGFSPVISIIPSPANLHNYDELGVTWVHCPLTTEEPAKVLGLLYPQLKSLTAGEGKVLVHGEELGDRVCGAVAGYLLWSGLLPDGPTTISAMEQLANRQLGPAGRELVALADRLRPAS